MLKVSYPLFGTNIYSNCSLIGSLIISFGFYMLIWAKAQEVKGERSPEGQFVASSSANAPLLEQYDDSRNEEREPLAA